MNFLLSRFLEFLLSFQKQSLFEYFNIHFQRTEFSFASVKYDRFEDFVQFFAEKRFFARWNGLLTKRRMNHREKNCSTRGIKAKICL